MKCLISAIGDGCSWGLLGVKGTHSLLQEMIARNIPFCEEFLIAANANEKLIIEGQMEAFRGLKYKCISADRRGDAIVNILKTLEPSEIVLVLTANIVTDSTDYKELIVEALKAAECGHIAVLGTDCNYLFKVQSLLESASSTFFDLIADNMHKSKMLPVKPCSEAVEAKADPTDIIKLEPAFKDYLWGGTKLKDIYNKKCDYDIVAESWELSSHKDGRSVVAEGLYKGKKFDEYLNIVGKDALGWKGSSLDRFPILIKFIDAQKALSIQVHPDDNFAIHKENEYGKSEMWYIMDCDDDAFIYYGVRENITKEEFEKRIDNNTILEVLNKVHVKKGDTYFVEAGTIHAIGAGILICEIQQNSNCTYRIYDYDRRDKDGNARELHVEKAKEVCNLKEIKMNDAHSSCKEVNGEYSVEIIGSCKYFESEKYDVIKRAEFLGDDETFASVIILEGTGYIEVGDTRYDFNAADSFFIPAGKKKVVIDGKCSFIKTRV